MKILATMPGRYGDILWSLATARALAEAYDTAIDFAISAKYGSLQALIQAQPYIACCVVDGLWDVQETAPMTPRIPTACVAPGYDVVYHLGYAGWPERPLPYECARLANIHRESRGEPLLQVVLDRPWITAPANPDTDPGKIVVGWSDEWFELKYGLTELIFPSDDPVDVLVPPQSRWAQEHRWGSHVSVDHWEEATARIATADLFVGCCSALHVLACGVGTPVLLVEPNPQRHHAIFYPYGKTGPRVRLLLGGDGQPTFDARHLKDAVAEMLRLETSDARV
jgi:hypothetical protein